MHRLNKRLLAAVFGIVVGATLMLPASAEPLVEGQRTEYGAFADPFGFVSTATSRAGWKPSDSWAVLANGLSFSCLEGWTTVGGKGGAVFSDIPLMPSTAYVSCWVNSEVVIEAQNEEIEFPSEPGMGYLDFAYPAAGGYLELGTDEYWFWLDAYGSCGFNLSMHARSLEDVHVHGAIQIAAELIFSLYSSHNGSLGSLLLSEPIRFRSRLSGNLTTNGPELEGNWSRLVVDPVDIDLALTENHDDLGDFSYSETHVILDEQYEGVDTYLFDNRRFQRGPPAYKSVFP